jgi:hypothetical protein
MGPMVVKNVTYNSQPPGTPFGFWGLHTAPGIKSVQIIDTITPANNHTFKHGNATFTNGDLTVQEF